MKWREAYADWIRRGQNWAALVRYVIARGNLWVHS